MNRRSFTKNRLSRLALATLPGLLLLTSCNTAEKPDLTITREQPEGFPVPAGFRFLEGRSYSYSSGAFESATYVWSGNDEIQSVADFYRRRMPDHGWRPMEEVNENEGTRLGLTISFTRDAKRVDVKVHSEEVRGRISKNLNVTMRVLPLTEASS